MQTLEKAYLTPEFQMVVLYGGRRIGKWWGTNSAKRTLAFYNFLERSEEIGLDFAEDTYDGSHL